MHWTFSSLLFWLMAVLVGTVQGGIQALSRSYFGQLVPPNRSNEYFGFFDIFGKFAAVIGPLLYSLFYMLTGRASIGIIILMILFALGGHHSGGRTTASALGGADPFGGLKKRLERMRSSRFLIPYHALSAGNTIPACRRILSSTAILLRDQVV